MTDSAHRTVGHVEPFPKSPFPKGITEQLTQIRDALSAEFPQASSVTLDFDGMLHAHIDVRNSQDVLLVETRLPGMCGGIFGKIKHGASPNHPFQHRVSVIVDR